MRATLLCSCGLLLESHGEKLLIDAPNGNFPPFYALPEDSVQRLAAGAGEFLGLRGMIFTHLHPDHYDAQRVETVLCAQPQLKIFLPDWNMPECVWLTIGRFRIEHTNPISVVNTAIHNPVSRKKRPFASFLFIRKEYRKAAPKNKIITQAST